MEIRIDKYEYRKACEEIEKELSDITIINAEENPEIDNIPTADRLVDIVLEVINIRI